MSNMRKIAVAVAIGSAHLVSLAAVSDEEAKQQSEHYESELWKDL